MPAYVWSVKRFKTPEELTAFLREQTPGYIGYLGPSPGGRGWTLIAELPMPPPPPSDG